MGLTSFINNLKNNLRTSASDNANATYADLNALITNLNDNYLGSTVKILYKPAIIGGVTVLTPISIQGDPSGSASIVGGTITPCASLACKCGSGGFFNNYGACSPFTLTNNKVNCKHCFEVFNILYNASGDSFVAQLPPTVNSDPNSPIQKIVATIYNTGPGVIASAQVVEGVTTELTINFFDALIGAPDPGSMDVSFVEMTHYMVLGTNDPSNSGSMNP